MKTSLKSTTYISSTFSCAIFNDTEKISLTVQTMQHEHLSNNTFVPAV